MQLTEKCKDDFEIYVLSKSLEIRFRQLVKVRTIENKLFVSYEDVCELLLNGLIAEFFEQFQYGGENLFHHYFNYYWNIKLKSQSINDIFLQTIEMCNLIYNKNKVMLSNP